MPADVEKVVAAAGAFEHHVFAGRIQEGEELSPVRSAVVEALRVPEGDDRDWNEIERWATTITDSLLFKRLSAGLARSRPQLARSSPCRSDVVEGHVVGSPGLVVPELHAADRCGPQCLRSAEVREPDAVEPHLGQTRAPDTRMDLHRVPDAVRRLGRRAEAGGGDLVA